MPHILFPTQSVYNFGYLRQHGLGFTVECRRCEHARQFSYKAGRFLLSRLPDALKLSSAVGMFHCTG
jgi:hypothetical protein